MTRRLDEDKTTSWLVLGILFLILLAIGMLLAFCVMEPKSAYAQEPYVVAVRNFGRPMEPIAPAFTNDPERIVLSQNFYSVQPNARQTRNGYVSAFNYSSLTSSTVDAITTFGQQGDSAAIVFMAGGKWWYTFYGAYTGGKLNYVSSLATPREVKPYTPGTISNLDTGSTNKQVHAATLTAFSRHLQRGDTLHLSDPTDTCIVQYIYGDNELFVDTTSKGWDIHSADSWDATRSYSGSDPWLYASGKYVYSGSVKDPPQVIYNKDDTLFIRPLIMVDSFYIDNVISSYVDTIGGDQVRRSYEKAGSDSAITEVQLVSRRAFWAPDQWITSTGGAPVTYFVRLGWWTTNTRNSGRIYTIRGNTDTSLYIANWYRTTNVSPNGISTANWDSLHCKWADTMLYGDLTRAAHWGYIYTAVGNYDVVLTDSATPSATLFGRGAIWKVTDPAPSLIDTSTFVNGLYYIHTTSDDISFPAYTAGSDMVYTYTIGRLLSSCWGCPGVPINPGLTNADLPALDSIIDYREESHMSNGQVLYGRYLGARVYGIWTIKSLSPKRPVQSQFVNNGYYPVRFARRFGDTVYFVSSACGIDMLADTTRDTTSQWEIVKVGMPSWSGMTSWGNPPQLAAWGDTSSPSMVSFAQPQDPWNWTGGSDVNVGLDLDDPIVGLLGFDDQLLVFKRNSITGFNGTSFSEISNGDGLIARDALTSDNKMAYWLDVNGPKRISRRDFSGYTIEKIGLALDPVFNTWSQGYFGTSVVPFYMNPAYKDQAVLRYNEFDEHLYLYFAADSTTTNNRTLTYSIPRQEWDGYFTYGASAAMPFSWKDTSCILFARNDTARVYRTSMTWSDNGAGITSKLKSGRFWVNDKSGWPIEGKLERVRFTGRGSDILLDSLQVVVTVNDNMSGNVTSSAKDSVTIDMATNVSDGQFTWYPSSDMTGTYWDWRIDVKNRTGGTLFAPYEMLFEFTPVGREK